MLQRFGGWPPTRVPSMKIVCAGGHKRDFGPRGSIAWCNRTAVHVHTSPTLTRPTDFATSSQRAALAEAQEGLDIVMAQLKDAKARLAGVQNRLAELQKGFDDAVAKKQVRKDPTPQVAPFDLRNSSAQLLRASSPLGMLVFSPDSAVTEFGLGGYTGW